MPLSPIRLTRTSTQTISEEQIQILENENDKLIEQVLQAVCGDSLEANHMIISKQCNEQNSSSRINSKRQFNDQQEESVEEDKEMTSQHDEILDTELALQVIKTQMDNLNESI